MRSASLPPRGADHRSSRVTPGRGGGLGQSARPVPAPFTPEQYEELERQKGIYKYLVAGVPVPPYLTVAIRSGIDTHLTLGGYLDPEPGRCRRTDGNKWMCSKEAASDSNPKYCERHVRRRSSSRTPVEPPAATTVPTGGGGGASNILFSSSMGSSQLHMDHAALGAGTTEDLSVGLERERPLQPGAAAREVALPTEATAQPGEDAIALSLNLGMQSSLQAREEEARRRAEKERDDACRRTAVLERQVADEHKRREEAERVVVAQTRIIALQSELAGQRREIEQLRSTAREVEKRREEAEEEARKAREEAVTARGEAAAAKEDADKARKEAASTREHLTSRVEHLKKLEDDFALVSGQRDTLKEQVRQVTLHGEEVAKEVQALKDSVGEKEVALSGTGREIEMLRATIQDKNEALSTANKTVDGREVFSEDFWSCLDWLKERSFAKSRLIHQMRSALEQIPQLLQAALEVATKAEEEARKAREEAATARGEAAASKEDKARKEAEIEMLRATIQDKNEALSTANKTVDGLRVQIVRLETDIEDLRNHLYVAQDGASSLHSLLQAEADGNRKLQDAITTLCDALGVYPDFDANGDPSFLYGSF